MLNKIKRQSYALRQGRVKDEVYETCKDNAQKLVPLALSLKQDISQFLKAVSNCVKVNRDLAASLFILAKNVHIKATDESYEAAQAEAHQFLENVSLVDSVWAGNFDGILSQSVDASAFLKLKEFQLACQKVLDRIPDRDNKQQTMEYYRDKVEGLEKKIQENPDQAADYAVKAQRNHAKLQDAEESYFAINEVLKVQLSVLHTDRLDVIKSVFCDFIHSQRLCFGALGTSLELVEQDNQSMRNAFRLGAAPQGPLNPIPINKQKKKKAGLMNRFKRNVLGVGQSAKNRFVDLDYDRLDQGLQDFIKATDGALSGLQTFSVAALSLQEQCARFTTQIFTNLKNQLPGEDLTEVEGLANAVSKGEHRWVQLCKDLSEQVQNLAAHLSKLKTEEKEIMDLLREREEARSQFDYYRKQIQDLKKNEAGNAKEIAKTEPKMEQAKQEFEPINSQAKTVLTHALNAKFTHMSYLLGGFLHCQKIYLNGISEAWDLKLPGYDEDGLSSSSVVVYSTKQLQAPDPSGSLAHSLSAPSPFPSVRSSSSSAPSTSPGEDERQRVLVKAQLQAQAEEEEADADLESVKALQREKAAMKARLKAELAQEDEALDNLMKLKKSELQRDKLKQEIEEEDREIERMLEAKKQMALSKQKALSRSVVPAAASVASETAPPSFSKPPRPHRASIVNDSSSSLASSSIAPSLPGRPSKQQTSTSTATGSPAIAAATSDKPTADSTNSLAPIQPVRSRAHSGLDAVRNRYLQSTKEVEEKAQRNVAAMKAKRGEGIVGLTQEQKEQAATVLGGTMGAKAERDGQVDDAIKSIRLGVVTEKDGSTHTLTEVNLNNTSVFRTCGKETLIDKYKELCGAVATNQEMKKLELTNAEVDDDFCQQLAAALQNHASLTEVNLNSNPISSRGVRALAGALRTNTSLRVLKLHNLSRDVDHDTEQTLLRVLEANTTLTKLVFSFKQRRENELKEKYLDRNVAALRLERLRSASTASDTSRERNLSTASDSTSPVGSGSTTSDTVVTSPVISPTSSPNAGLSVVSEEVSISPDPVTLPAANPSIPARIRPVLANPQADIASKKDSIVPSSSEANSSSNQTLARLRSVSSAPDTHPRKISTAAASPSVSSARGTSPLSSLKSDTGKEATNVSSSAAVAQNTASVSVSSDETSSSPKTKFSIQKQISPPETDTTATSPKTKIMVKKQTSPVSVSLTEDYVSPKSVKSLAQQHSTVSSSPKAAVFSTSTARAAGSSAPNRANSASVMALSAALAIGPPGPGGRPRASSAQPAESSNGPSDSIDEESEKDDTPTELVHLTKARPKTSAARKRPSTVAFKKV
eukprot:gb/GEZN01000557.1/.p1 GENE.gb/GEZN01000557.1/~~gb/GEZN01000557.1/.p1  ORF type:complete len:1330 (+),score=318.63 gb/GEZN01000557.1/:115-4104(+)